MEFQDRADAGKRLADALSDYKSADPIILAIPKGGVEIGLKVAKGLEADFSILITRKLPFPDNPEAGFGAIAEDGSTFMYKDAARWMPDDVVSSVAESQRKEIERRIRVLRSGKPLPPLRQRTVILVDDGIAMGSTMKASIKMCRKRGARKIIVGVPVTGRETADGISSLADDLRVLVTPPFFRAVAQVYRNWYDVSDAEVMEMLEPRGKKRK